MLAFLFVLLMALTWSLALTMNSIHPPWHDSQSRVVYYYVFTLPPIGVQRIAVACLCAIVRLPISKSQKPCVQTSGNLLQMLPVAVAQSSTSDDNAMCYVLPVLWMTSSLLKMGHTEIADFRRGLVSLARRRQQCTREETADCASQCCYCCYFR